MPFARIAGSYPASFFVIRYYVSSLYSGCKSHLMPNNRSINFKMRVVSPLNILKMMNSDLGLLLQSEERKLACEMRDYRNSKIRILNLENQ